MGIKPNKLELNKILWDELTISIRDYFNTRYANTKISDKAKNDLIKGGVSNAVVYWNLQANKEAKTIGRNPKKEIAEKRLNILRQRSDSNERIIKAVANYIAMEFEHYMNLGHTDAYAYLNSEATIVTPPSKKLINSKLHYSFKYKGDLRHFHKQCIEYKVLNPETSLKSFKIAFEGCDYREEKPLKWIKKQENHVVYLFDLLLKKKLIHNKIFINDKYIDVYSDVTIGALIGKTNKQVSSTRSSWKILDKNATPENSDFIRNLVDTLVL